MPVTAISFYRGGSIDAVLPVARRMKAVLLTYGVSYQVTHFPAATDIGDWMVTVRYPDQATHDEALARFPHDPEHRQVIAALSGLVTFLRRVLVVELDL